MSYDKLEEAKSFFKIHGKRPSTIANDGTEKELSNWISTQLTNREKCQKSMSNEKNRDLWDAFKNKYIECFKSNEWTIERIDNSIGHNKGNVEISCLNCNLRRRTMHYERYLFFLMWH